MESFFIWLNYAMNTQEYDKENLRINIEFISMGINRVTDKNYNPVYKVESCKISMFILVTTLETVYE